MGVGRIRGGWASLCVVLAAAGVLTPLTGGIARAGILRSMYTDVDLDRLAYHDGVHTAEFLTLGLCLDDRDTVDVTRPCSGGSVEGTITSARLGFEAQRYVEAVPADIPVVQTQTAEGEQLVRVVVDVHDGGGLLVEMNAVATDGLSARPVEGSGSDGARYDEGSVSWDLGTVDPGRYEMSARFTVSGDPQRMAGFVPEVIVQRSGATRIVARSHSGGIDAGHDVLAFHTLTLQQHVPAPSAPPKLDPGAMHGDADAPMQQAWGIMPSFTGRGTYYDPAGGVSKSKVHELAKLEPDAVGNASAGSIGWSYWSPQPGPKVEPVTEFAYRKGPVFEGFEIGIKSAGFLRFGVIPQTPAPIYDGDGGSIGVTASTGVVRAKSDRPPTRPGGRLTTSWDGSVAEAWTDLSQSGVPSTEPNSTAPGSSTFTEPSRLLEAGVQVFAQGGDVDNRSGRKSVVGKPIVLRGQWSFAAIGTAAPRGTNYRARIKATQDALKIVPTIGPRGYMLETERLGWDHLDWTAFHSLGWLEYAPQRSADQKMIKAYSFPRGATGRIDVLWRDGVHRVLSAGPGVWRLTVDAGGAELVKVGAAR